MCCSINGGCVKRVIKFITLPYEFQAVDHEDQELLMGGII